MASKATHLGNEYTTVCGEQARYRKVTRKPTEVTCKKCKHAIIVIASLQKKAVT